MLKTIHDGKPPAADDIWQRLNITRYWQLLVQDAIEGYYAHPYAWDEIGFGGPAYPRGYMRQGSGKPEPWEVAEQRYDWDPPPKSLSGEYSPIGGQGDANAYGAGRNALSLPSSTQPERTCVIEVTAFGAFQNTEKNEHHLGPIQTIKSPMRKYALVRRSIFDRWGGFGGRRTATAVGAGRFSRRGH